MVLLLGNHDLHYLNEHYRDLSMSCRYNEEYSDYYSQLFKEGGKFKLAHEEIVGHTQQFCGLPFITPHFACLDTRSAYVLDAQGINVVVPTLI